MPEKSEYRLGNSFNLKFVSDETDAHNLTAHFELGHLHSPSLRGMSIILAPPPMPLCSHTQARSGLILAQCAISFAFRRLSCKWNHVANTGTLFCLAPFTQHNVSEILPCCRLGQQSALLFNC